MSRDQMVHACKDEVTRLICEAVKKDSRVGVEQIAQAVDNLNKAWDALTDHLVRQRAARDATISHLHNEIAELGAPKGTVFR